MSYYTGLAAILFFAAVLAAQAPYLLVVDASGSMKDTLPPDYAQTKMEAARVAAIHFVDKTDAEIGLMIFDDCDSAADVYSGHIRLLQNFTRDKDELKARISQLKPNAATPISDALQEAELYFQTTHQQGTIILITDGEETCGGNAVIQAGRIYNESTGTVHVIGYLIGGEAEENAREIAQAGGGKYYPVNNTAELENALGRISGNTGSPIPCCASVIILAAIAFVGIGQGPKRSKRYTPHCR